MTRPLDGVLVVSLEQAVSAPYCTRLLADAGARVIKVERPGVGDFARHFDTFANGTGAHFAWCNRNKESLSLDFASAPGREILEELIGCADVLVDNLAPGAAARLGIDAAAVLERHPGKVVCEISGYGTGGDYDERRAYDLLIQAEAAVATVTGSVDEPIKPGVGFADISAGIFAANSILSALLLKARTGEGSALEVSMLDAMMDWMGYPLVVAKHGHEPQMARGMSHPAIAPYDAYPTSDGRLIAISVQNDREWHKLAVRFLDLPEMADDQRFRVNEARVANRDLIDDVLAPAVAKLTAADAVTTLHEAGIACSVVNTVEEVVDHPQLVARGRWLEVAAPQGPVATPLAPPLTAAWSTPTGGVPALGEHTDAILADLGRDADAIETLRSQGVV